MYYDLKSLKKTFVNEHDLFKYLEQQDYLPILPVDSLASFPKLRIGKTPIYRTSGKLQSGDSFELMVKDDSQNPTYSFKDRASALVSAWAKEHNIQTIVAASTGNAGSSLAGICASQGQNAIIFVPKSAPVAKLTQILMYGARIIPVDGTYDQAFDLSVKASQIYGFYNRNTAFNPLTIEGKKTVSFEIFSQLKQEMPNVIFVPVGDGVIISGVYKGFEDLLQLGIIKRMPRIIAVQAEGSSNLIKNIGSNTFSIAKSSTVADSISVDIPRNFHMAGRYIVQYDGETCSVTDEEILDASVVLSRTHGLFAEPAASAAFAGFLKFKTLGKIEKDSRNLVLLTGSGLKDLNAVKSKLSLPEAVSPDSDSIKGIVESFHTLTK